MDSARHSAHFAIVTFHGNQIHRRQITPAELNLTDREGEADIALFKSRHELQVNLLLYIHVLVVIRIQHKIDHFKSQL